LARFSLIVSSSAEVLLGEVAEGDVQPKPISDTVNISSQDIVFMGSLLERATASL